MISFNPIQFCRNEICTWISHSLKILGWFLKPTREFSNTVVCFKTHGYVSILCGMFWSNFLQEYFKKIKPTNGFWKSTRGFWVKVHFCCKNQYRNVFCCKTMFFIVAGLIPFSEMVQLYDGVKKGYVRKGVWDVLIDLSILEVTPKMKKILEYQGWRFTITFARPPTWPEYEAWGASQE